MQPLYKDDAVTLCHGDCIAGMKQLPEGLYDIIVTSPPYAVGKAYEETQSFGEYLKLISDFYTEGLRIIAKGGYAVVVFADYYLNFTSTHAKIQPMTYLHHLIAERAGWQHQTTRIWLKDFATLDDKFSIGSNLPKQEHEFIATFRKPGGGREKVREQKWHPRSVWSTAGIKQSIPAMARHIAAYPEALVQIILEVYSDKGDMVVDPFAGSGTTLYVAKRMSRRAIGFELDEENFIVARERLAQQTIEQVIPYEPPEEQKNFLGDVPI